MKKILILAILSLCSCSYDNLLAIKPMMTYGAPAPIISTVTITPSVLAVYTPIASTTPSPIITVTAVQALNIRSGPGKQYPTVSDPLPTGSALVSLGNCQHTDSGWWLNVMYGKIGGYVNQTYVSEQVCK